ncbi:MAG: hypothetical protein C4583_17820 [Anaerolineaceae bacterium]|nr:MAG: hypothetical protein C4583_17820 [Anaerolineaceae bacterium]
MKDRYAQIKFFASNYSRLQGLRLVPVGLLSLFVATWSNTRQGQLDGPLTALLVTILLYWLIDRYYNRVFGQVKQTPSQRKRETITSIAFGALALLAFALDTAEIIPVCALGLVFAAALFADFWHATRSVRKEAFATFPENFAASILILIVSILPLFGITWWEGWGIKSQVTGVFVIVGIVIFLTGIWGHIRITRDLSTVEAKTDEHTL